MTSTWFMLVVLIVSVLWAAIDSYATGRVWPLVVVLLFATFVVRIMKEASAVTTVIFERARRTVTVTHRRDGAVIDETVTRFEDITNAIVGASRGYRPNHLGMRPALLAGDRLIPLTRGEFIARGTSRKIAMEIRRFLNLPPDNLIEDSVRALARRGRKRDAVGLARKELGLHRIEATTLVTELSGGA